MSPKNVIAALAALQILLVTARALPPEPPPLRFRTDGTFKLAQLTDLHLGESGEKDAKTLQLVHTTLNTEQPDLAILSGDLVSGYAYRSFDLLGAASRRFNRASLTGSWYERQWRQLASLLQAAHTPWATILGNHDGEADLGRQSIITLDSMAGGELSLTRQGPAGTEGAGNYFLDVLEPQGSAVAARIWMLDSGNRGCGGSAEGWGCVGPDTVDWVRHQAQLLPTVPSLAFIHIPLPQLLEAWRNPDMAPNGTKAEDTGCPITDTGLFAVAREVGISAMYFGHDHSNDFCGSLQGVRLAYGRKTGFGSYSSATGLPHGARIIELRMGQDPAVSETWIREDDGSRLQQAPAQEPRVTQYECEVGEHACDRLLGSSICLKMRNSRNTVVLLATATALLAALALSVCMTVACRQVVGASPPHPAVLRCTTGLQRAFALLPEPLLCWLVRDLARRQRLLHPRHAEEALQLMRSVESQPNSPC